MSVIKDVFPVSPAVRDNPSAFRHSLNSNRLGNPVSRMLEEILVMDGADEIITITSCSRGFTSPTKEVK